MYFGEIDEIRGLAEKAAERDGVPFYILQDPSRKEKAYTAVSSVGFGLPGGFLMVDRVTPENEREELEPPEKTSTNGF
ncbi:MAG TPA: hypothetical protein PLM22_10970 [Candidatus Sabulitectum sp.]|nr:hypothetical protein [Candidatus Sabulitectum sp.]HPJ29444.1 hypothetical protein [Candidatus Sabulitectum sp.]